MQKIRTQIHAAGGEIMIFYTRGNKRTDALPAYKYFKRFFHPDYIIGDYPPIEFDAWPWTIVIDMHTGIVLLNGHDVTIDQITAAVQQANY